MMLFYFIPQSCIVLPLLLKASYHDVKTREVPDKLWLFMLLGLPFTMVDVILAGTMLYALASVAISVAFALILFYFFKVGGADAKALIVLSIVYPVFAFMVTTLFFSSFFALITVTTLAVCLKKKVWVIPFVPFLTLGFAVALALFV
jgi:Flp pilus assembly protein protease CpaA